MSSPPLVLHSSPVRLALQALTPVLLLGLGLTGLSSGGGAVPIGITVLGVGAALVVLLDLPVRSEFTPDGILRVCPLRRHYLPWPRVVAVERIGGSSRRRSDVQPRPPSRTRGLVARTGPRRLHLLVDRRESHAEWATLKALVKDRATQLRATEPPLDAAPAGRGPRALHRRQDT